MSGLKVREAYRLWAPLYATETVVSLLDKEVAAALSPPIRGVRLLDAGCGIGRRLTGNEAAFAVGLDISPEMLAAGGRTDVLAADIRALPFAASEFDVIWCRLVLGHLAELPPALRELARVCRIGGSLLLTDFHPDAVAMGHRRSFRDASGAVHAVEHYVHDYGAYRIAAAEAGFDIVAQRDGVVGPSVATTYQRSGRAEAYQKDMGLALVAGFLFRRRL